MSELEIYKGMVKKMKNVELKEKLKLIDGFFNKAWACDLDEVYHAVIDTITNLQQELETRQYDINNLTYQLAKEKEENEELKKNQRYYKNGVFSLEYDKETMSDMIDDYKSRCEKANKELINSKEYQMAIAMELNAKQSILIKLDNTLNGRSDE